MLLGGKTRIYTLRDGKPVIGTLGIVLSSTQDGRPVFLTAGHCVGSPGTGVYLCPDTFTGTEIQIGVVEHNMFHPNSGDDTDGPFSPDIAIVRLHEGVPFEHATVDVRGKLIRVTQFGQPVANKVVALVGGQSGTHVCKISKPQVTVRVSGETLDSVTELRLRNDDETRPGDSGGPVVENQSFLGTYFAKTNFRRHFLVPVMHLEAYVRI